MNQRKTFTLLALVVAVLILGVAYAAISNVTLSVAGNVTASPDQGNFKVGFNVENCTFTTLPVETRESGNEIDVAPGFAEDGEGFDYLGCSLDISNFSVKGDKVIARFEVKNNSTDITALVSASATAVIDPYDGPAEYGGAEYFKVTSEFENNVTSIAPNGTAYFIVTVELIKTPIKDTVGAHIIADLVATPIN